MVWQAVVERFEQQAPASVMARLALEQALPAHWIDEVFETHRQRQYPRELLFSTVVELMTLVSLGLRPSLHAAARKLDERLPVSLTALYDKVNRCEPAVLRALVQGSAQRLAPLSACLSEQASLPGWQLAFWTATTCPPATSGWPCCAAFAVLPSRATHWCSTTPTVRWCAISWRVKTRTRASAWPQPPSWSRPRRSRCGSQTGTSAPKHCCAA